MPRYISHYKPCNRLSAVTCLRFVSDSLEGKLLGEFEAPDKGTVVAFLNAHNMRPQWVMRVENDW